MRWRSCWINVLKVSWTLSMALSSRWCITSHLRCHIPWKGCSRVTSTCISCSTAAACAHRGETCSAGRCGMMISSLLVVRYYPARMCSWTSVWVPMSIVWAFSISRWWSTIMCPRRYLSLTVYRTWTAGRHISIWSRRTSSKGVNWMNLTRNCYAWNSIVLLFISTL